MQKEEEGKVFFTSAPYVILVKSKFLSEILEIVYLCSALNFTNHQRHKPKAQAIQKELWQHAEWTLLIDLGLLFCPGVFCALNPKLLHSSEKPSVIFSFSESVKSLFMTHFAKRKGTAK